MDKEEVKRIIVENFKLRPDVFKKKFPEVIKIIYSYTKPHLDETNNLREHYYWILNDLTSFPLCKHCNTNPTKWNSQNNKYRDFCSTKCMSNSQEIRERTKNTCLQKYGGVAPAVNNEIQNKIKQTLYSHYGNLGLKHDSIKYKKQQTCLEKYGVKNPSQSLLFKHKKQQTSLNNFNTNHPLQNPEILEKQKNTLLNKYNVSNIRFIDGVEQKRQQTLLERYGVDNSGRIHYSPELLKKISDQQWLEYQHKVLKKTRTQIANELGISKSVIFDAFKKFNIIVDTSISSGEQQLQQFLCLLGIEIQTNVKNIIKPYELDIFIPQYNIAIEYCGLFWHCDFHPRITRNYHKNKLDLCQQQQIRLITIFEDEWLYKQHIVKQKILSILNRDDRKILYGRNTNIVTVSTKDKQQFFNENHIQGDGPSSINIGLEYNGELVACMGFISQKQQYYLNRYATKYRIVGGMSKLLKYFKQTYPEKQIISFADLRWSEGKSYYQCGFELVDILPPDYYYVDLNRCIRIHKFNFRHKNLPRILNNYDPSLSEDQNTKNNNWYKIYNCGLLKFSL